MVKYRVLIDTDIGDDTDDALTLAYCFSNLDKLEIAAITTVLGDVKKRAESVAELLTAFNLEIPVFKGSPKPFAGDNGIDYSRLKIPTEFHDTKNMIKEEDAVDVIGREASKGDLIILALGPMTNLALAYEKYPEEMKKVKIYAMAGTLGYAFTEWNIASDVEAFEVVLSKCASLKLITLDETVKTALSEEELSSLLPALTGRLTSLKRNIQDWKKLTGFNPILHDVLVPLMLLYPSSFTFRQKQLKVLTSPGELKGMLYTDDNPFTGKEAEDYGNHQYVKSFDRDKAYKSFVQSILENR